MSDDKEVIHWCPEFDTFILPRPSEWRCIAFGVSYHPMKGHHPNWFHRQMSSLLLGVRWVKDKGGE